MLPVRVDWNVVLWSGLVATTFAAATFWLFRTFGRTRFTPATALGGIVFPDPRTPLAETVGQVVFFVLQCTIVAAVYAAILAANGGPSAASGALLGGVHGVLGVALLPVIGTISASVRSGHEEPPGRFGTRWGSATPFSMVTGHVIYGALLGAALKAFSVAQIA